MSISTVDVPFDRGTFRNNNDIVNSFSSSLLCRAAFYFCRYKASCFDKNFVPHCLSAFSINIPTLN